MPTAGSASYAMVGSTKPTMGDGTVAPGTFTGSLAVNFAQMKLGWESTIAVNGQNYVFNTSGGLAAPSVTLGTDGRWVGSSVAANGYQGRGYGFLAGDGASHAGFSYFITPQTGGNPSNTITGTAENTFSNPAEKHLGRLCADLSYAQVDEIIKTGLHEYVDSLQTRLNQIHDGIYKTFFEIHSEEASAAVGG